MTCTRELDTLSMSQLSVSRHAWALLRACNVMVERFCSSALRISPKHSCLTGSSLTLLPAPARWLTLHPSPHRPPSSSYLPPQRDFFPSTWTLDSRRPWEAHFSSHSTLINSRCPPERVLKTHTSTGLVIFIEVNAYSIHHLNHLKMYNAGTLSSFTVQCYHHYDLIPDFHHLQRRPINQPPISPLWLTFLT